MRSAVRAALFALCRRLSATESPSTSRVVCFFFVLFLSDKEKEHPRPLARARKVHRFFKNILKNLAKIPK